MQERWHCDIILEGGGRLDREVTQGKRWKIQVQKVKAGLAHFFSQQVEPISEISGRSSRVGETHGRTVAF